MGKRPSDKRFFQELEEILIENNKTFIIDEAKEAFLLESALKGFRGQSTAAWPGLTAILAKMDYPMDVIAKAQSRVQAERGLVEETGQKTEP
ncbi:MAG: hypothetical protein LBS60_07965 [Deltaproteobacteria bacterium]|jgi:hypothetical protein|nr:hypothetical protein [Deltaproteobacteria bacterium]